MAYRKGESPEERANRKKVRDSQAKEEARIRAESERLRAENAGQPGYDEKGNLQTTDQLPDDIEEPRPDTNLGDFQEQGGYLEPLEASGMPPEIDPQKHKAQQKQKKIRTIAEEGSTEGERSAGQGKLKDQTQLPNLYQSKGTPLQKQDAAENQGFDQDVADAMEREGRARIDALLEAGRRSGRIATPQGQLEMISQAALLGGAALLYFTQTAAQLMLIR